MVCFFFRIDWHLNVSFASFKKILFCIFKASLTQLPGYTEEEISQILVKTKRLVNEPNSNGNLLDMFNLSCCESLEKNREREQIRMKSDLTPNATELLEERAIKLIVDPIDTMVAKLNMIIYDDSKNRPQNAGKS